MSKNIQRGCFLNSCETSTNTSSRNERSCPNSSSCVYLMTFVFGIWILSICLIVRQIYNDAKEVKITGTTMISAEYRATVKNIVKNTQEPRYVENVTIETIVTSKLKIYTREEWEARESLGNCTGHLTHPIQLVVIGHTAGRNCESLDSCIYIVRAIQSWQVGSLSHVDIGYNFLIGGDGGIYEGVGWNETNSVSINCLFVTFIGNYIYDKLNKQQEEALVNLLDYGVNNGYVHINYKLVGHNQVKSTLSPGTNVINFIKNLSNYYAQPIVT